MDFKWTLSRPGIELEFETGSISEAVGMLQEEGTKIAEVFGFTMGNSAQAAPTPEPAAAPEPEKPRKPRAPKVEAVAPPPLPVPTAPSATTLPPNTLQGAPTAPDLDIPASLRRDANNTAPALGGGLPNLPAPPTAPLPPTAPPVGVLGPKVVAALEKHKAGNPVDADGKLLVNWLAASGLVIAGSSYDDACRVVLMTADDKLKDVAAAFGV